MRSRATRPARRQRAERDKLAAAFRHRTDADAARLGAVGPHSLDNPAFVEFLTFGASGAVRPALRGVFPDRRHALMVVRLGGDLTIDQQGSAANHVVSLVHASDFRGVRAQATGSPLLVKEINDRMRGDMLLLGAFAALAMAVVLLLVFRVRWRLLSLAVMALGVVWAFGAIGYLGIPLTMVTISGFPILIGLGVDFAVQIHSRYEDELASDPNNDLTRALGRTFLRLGPAVTVAAVAAVVGFLALRMSNVPMVRDFGVLLSIGTGAVFAAALVAMPAVLVWRDRRRHRTRPNGGGGRVERATLALATAGRHRPMGLLVVSLVIVALGPLAMGRVSVESDPERWVPQDSGVLRDLRALRAVAGSSAELGLMVEARDVLRPEVLRWMSDFETRAIKQYGRQLVSSTSVASITSQVTGSEPTESDVRAILSVAPAAIRRSFIGHDDTRAQILFAIGPISLEQRKLLVARMIDGLHAPPGVVVTPSGLAVVGTEAVTSLTANREQMSYLALAAVFIWMLIALRSLQRALLVLLPVITALALSSTVIYLFGITVNTLAAISGPLVIATCTEFTVLIMERYLEERRGGRRRDRGSRDSICPHRSRLRRVRARDRGRLRCTRAVGLPAPLGLRRRRLGQRGGRARLRARDPAPAPRLDREPGRPTSAPTMPMSRSRTRSGPSDPGPYRAARSQSRGCSDLSRTDAGFVAAETPVWHMHVGVLAMFDADAATPPWRRAAASSRNPAPRPSRVVPTADRRDARAARPAGVGRHRRTRRRRAPASRDGRSAR